MLTSEEERLLTSTERPIVLADRREPSVIDPGVAPANPLLGIFLPYSPLHQLLLDRVDLPLVMTSGNVSDEPIAYTDEEALSRLAGIAEIAVDQRIKRRHSRAGQGEREECVVRR